MGNEILAAVILAAGKGKRMKSETPKVLHRVCGLPLVGYVLEASGRLGCGEIAIVVGRGAEEVTGTLGEGCRYALQAEQKGTGHAVMVALEDMDRSFTEVMVLPGDAPLIKPETLERLVAERRRSGAAASVLTARLEDPYYYGRVIRRPDGSVEAIVEEVDATEEQRAVREVNSCAYVFDRSALERGLGSLGTDNAQGEYYLTDVVGSFAAGGVPVVAVEGAPEEVLGVNDMEQLAEVAAVMRGRINSRLMAGGVNMPDPSSVYLDHGVEVGRGTEMLPMVFATGRTRIGTGCRIGPCVSLNDTRAGDSCEILFSAIDGREIAPGTRVGPFSGDGAQRGPDDLR